MKSCVGSSAKAWRRLDHINVVGQLGGCDASERPMLRIGFEGAWCKWYHIRFACRRPRAQSPACPFYRQRLMNSCVRNTAKACGESFDHINVVGQLGGCDVSGRPVLRCGFKGAWCSGITSASHAEGPGLNPQPVQFDLQRLMKSCVKGSAKAWLRLDHINVVGQLGGCDASGEPVLDSRARGVVVSHTLRMRRGSTPSMSI